MTTSATAATPAPPASPAPPAIVVAGLSKAFRSPGSLRDLFRGRLSSGEVTALVDISFTVAPGEIVAVVGPNGAGKSTLLRILAGLLTPSRGVATVLGRNADTMGSQVTYRRAVSIVIGDERSFLWPITGRQNLAYYAGLHGLPPGEARAIVDDLLARVGLAEAGDRRFAEYSRGMRQRLAVARGLLGNPEVLLLDEPTSGLDPRGAHALRRFLRDEVIRQHRRTAILGSHSIGEIEMMADRVLVLETGRLVAELAPSDLRNHLALD